MNVPGSLLHPLSSFTVFSFFIKWFNFRLMLIHFACCHDFPTQNTIWKTLVFLMTCFWGFFRHLVKFKVAAGNWRAGPRSKNKQHTTALFSFFLFASSEGRLEAALWQIIFWRFLFFLPRRLLKFIQQTLYMCKFHSLSPSAAHSSGSGVKETRRITERWVMLFTVKSPKRQAGNRTLPIWRFLENPVVSRERKEK